MQLKELLEFRKDLYFEGAVQIDWFYSPERSKKVAENFVFHGSEYFGVENVNSNKRIDTISLVKELSGKLSDDTSNPLSLAIADYGTGKSHLAVTLGLLLSGPDYMPETFDKVIANINKIDSEDANIIRQNCNRRNLVLTLNGMRDFNLHSELLKAAEKSLSLYGISDEKLRKINRALETAEMFFSRNKNSLLSNFEQVAKKYGWYLAGEELLSKITSSLLSDDTAFNIINEVYESVNGHQIRWDEGISATAILNQLVNEYCGINGMFDSVVILFDEFGRYLEYASGGESAKTGDSALQQIFECSQNSDGLLHVINFIQSDIKSYLQRVDNTKNISRYIGRYDVSDKYYISSNLETVFANLIQRKDTKAFNQIVVEKQNQNDAYWKKMFSDLNNWKTTSGVWNDYSLFRKVIVEGIYPMHPISTFMLTQLSDYLQNRSSLTLISRYIQNSENCEADGNFSILPEELMKGDLFTEMLTSEQEGKQTSQHCIRYSNILGKYEDKLSESALSVLRSNLIIRILRFKNNSLQDVKNALSYCCGLPIEKINQELDLLVNEYGILGFDDRANCFDFMEESNGAHDYKIIKKRILSLAKYNPAVIQNIEVQELGEFSTNVETQYGILKHISTKEWEFAQELYDISDFNESVVNRYIQEWKSAINANVPKGKLVWLYSNRETDSKHFDRVCSLCKNFGDKPIVVMLLNDADNHLANDLIEYGVLKTLDDQTKTKYARHYEDDVKQNKDRISVDFTNLKKERQHFTENGVVPFTDRLVKALTGIFGNIYPEVTSFSFDGFVSAKYNISKNQAKIYISILKALLSGEMNDSVIHSWPTETRNRFVALFDVKSRSSWKCLNEESHIIPPEDQKAKNVYDFITNNVEANNELKCNDIVSKLTMAPYGINFDAVVIMVCVVLSNLSYCTRMAYKDKVYSVQAWRDLLLVKDDKINVDVFNNSSLRHIDAGEISSKFIAIFKKIEDNKNADRVTMLSSLLNQTIQENELPSELESRCNYCRKILNDGVSAKSDFNEKMSEISSLDSGAQPKDLYPSLKAYTLLITTDFRSIFQKYNYNYTSDYSDRVFDKKEEIKDYISENFEEYLGTFRCKDVDHMITFRNHSRKTGEMFANCGFDEFAKRIADQSQSELSNMELIKSRATFVDDYNEFYQKCRITSFTSFDDLKNYRKECQALITRFNQFRPSLKKSDVERIKNGLVEKRDSIKKELSAAEEEMGAIFDDSYELNSLHDIDQLIVRISNVLRRGLNEKDSEEFNVLQDELSALKEDVIKINAAGESRKELEILENELIGKYEDKDSDLLNEDTISKFIQLAKSEMDKKEEIWVNANLSLGRKTDADLYRWKNSVSKLPGYLADKTLKQVKELDKYADNLIQQRKIETVIHYFNELSLEEQKQCLTKLQELIK